MRGFLLICVVFACLAHVVFPSSISSQQISHLRHSISKSGSKSVTFDGRSFIIDGERELLIAGSVHYPRLPQSEWSQVFQLLKASGVNLIQTYVFWDIHEPSQGSYYFPNDESPDNLVRFVELANKAGLYVNLRIGPYVCAEWNYGGLPVWLKSIKQPDNPDKTIVYRTDNQQWLDVMLAFSDKVIEVMSQHKLFYADGGPIIMLQLENEYGNIQAPYGEDGVTYIEKLASYITTKKETTHNLPWIMCQQGEGVGSAPPADIINTCNGYYCDNWIPTHQSAFPNQPHMFTENWPGWFQKWGEAVPHRPAVDVAFSVARWFARGGDYMNYYMAFGGTTYGRHVGGPSIITSYDYDVQVNEYAMTSEPKYSLLSNLHHILLENKHLLLDQPIAETVTVGANYCEQHTYASSDTSLTTGCLIFLSNWDTSHSCSFPVGSEGKTLTVSPWSVSILTGKTCDTATYGYSTRDTAKDITPTELTSNKLIDVALEAGVCELVPSQGVETRTSDYPVEQLQVTNDATDYLWYSTVIPASSDVSNATLSFSVSSDGGGLVYVFVNNERVSSHIPQQSIRMIPKLGSNVRDSSRVSVRVTLPKDQENTLTILSVTMGLTNYGSHLEEVVAGIISNVTLNGNTLTQWLHSIGLAGEAAQLPSEEKQWKKRASNSACNSIQWLRGSFYTKDVLHTSSSGVVHLAFDMLSGGLGKGSVWVNGFLLGRYWDIVATGYCSEDCSSESYTGAYNADRCRTGCGEPSQRLYKVPVDVLNSVHSGLPNSVVVTEESEKFDGKASLSFSVVRVSMVDKKA
mmetsp:Transcript_5604/g.6116  ORF Transcript_5604/g.6116 Transcript_5604/m.6116 type:complete len:801 (-) Transcript_5604:197-2599(-)